eukprot:354471-Chlamydomonas_euryale.AAC.4
MLQAVPLAARHCSFCHVMSVPSYMSEPGLDSNSRLRWQFQNRRTLLNLLRLRGPGYWRPQWQSWSRDGGITGRTGRMPCEMCTLTL